MDRPVLRREIAERSGNVLRLEGHTVLTKLYGFAHSVPEHFCFPSVR